MSLEDIKEKINSLYGAITFNRDGTKIGDEIMQTRLYNLASTLERYRDSSYNPYKSRAEALGLDFESVVRAAVAMCVPLDSLLDCLEKHINATYGGTIGPNALYGYTCMTVVFDEGDAFGPDAVDTHEESISSLKKRIKYCKNPMEKKNLEKELNVLYKSRKRRNK